MRVRKETKIRLKGKLQHCWKHFREALIMAVIMGTTSCLTNLLTKILWLLCAWKREKIPELLLRDANPELSITVFPLETILLA